MVEEGIEDTIGGDIIMLPGLALKITKGVNNILT